MDLKPLLRAAQRKPLFVPGEHPQNAGYSGDKLMQILPHRDAFMMIDQIDAVVEKRIEMARRYSVNLSGVVDVPKAPLDSDVSSNFFDYVIFSTRRDALRSYLHAHGVETKVKHPVLLCDHPVYQCQRRPAIPVADRLVSQMLSLPLHEKMENADVDYVCQVISDFSNAG